MSKRKTGTHKGTGFEREIELDGVTYIHTQKDRTWGNQPDFETIRMFIKAVAAHEEYLNQFGIFNIPVMLSVVDNLEALYARKGTGVGKPSYPNEIKQVAALVKDYHNFQREFKRVFPNLPTPSRTAYYKHR